MHSNFPQHVYEIFLLEFVPLFLHKFSDETLHGLWTSSWTSSFDRLILQTLALKIPSTSDYSATLIVYPNNIANGMADQEVLDFVLKPF